MFIRHGLRRFSIAAGVVGLMLCASDAGAQAAGSRRPPVLPPEAAAGAPDLAKLPKTPKVPVTFDGLFAERNARATAAVGYFRCMQSTITAIRTGVLGLVPVEWSITCLRQSGEWRGVFGQLRDGTIDVKMQYAIRGTTGAVTTAPVDTARVNGTARALLRGLSAPLPGGGRYEFTPVPLPQDKFVEVWFLPVPSNPTRVVVGGDSLIQMTADGVRELGHGRTTPPIRAVSVPLSGSSFVLESREQQIPTVSELVVAHMALDLVPEVRVLSMEYESVLTRGGRWAHRRRR